MVESLLTICACLCMYHQIFHSGILRLCARMHVLQCPKIYIQKRYFESYKPGPLAYDFFNFLEGDVLLHGTMFDAQLLREKLIPCNMTINLLQLEVCSKLYNTLRQQMLR